MRVLPVARSLMPPPRHRIGCFAALLALGVPGAAFAGTIEATYVISLAGLTIGKANLTGNVETDRYSLNVSASFTGLVGAVARAQGGASARGGLSAASAGANGVLSNGFTLRAENGSTTRLVQIAASSGNVRNVTIEPPFDTDQEDRIPLQAAHKLGVVDPLSALIMPSLSADPLDKANCERKLPVFDGTQRFDVVLSFAGVRQVTAESGYSGPALVCAARYVPVSGHRPGRRVLKFMAENRNMDAWLVPVNGGKSLVPFRISVKTLVGTSVIEARHFLAGTP